MGHAASTGGLLLLSFWLAGCAPERMVRTEDPQAMVKSSSAEKEQDSAVATGFVLAGETGLPEAQAIVAAAQDLGLEGLVSEPKGEEEVLLFNHELGAFLVMYADIRHPDAVEMPQGLFSPTPAEIEATSGHFVTALTGGRGTLKQTDLATAQFTGAVALANKAPAAMLGHGVTFHSTEAFVGAVVRAGEDGLPIPGAVDITMAGEPDGRASLLTHGMDRYGREELYAVTEASPARMKDAFEFVAAIAAWMLTIDTVFSDGETIGRSAEERIEIIRVDSPIEGNERVIKLEM